MVILEGKEFYICVKEDLLIFTSPASEISVQVSGSRLVLKELKELGIKAQPRQNATSDPEVFN